MFFLGEPKKSGAYATYTSEYEVWRKSEIPYEMILERFEVNLFFLGGGGYTMRGEISQFVQSSLRVSKHVAILP